MNQNGQCVTIEQTSNAKGADIAEVLRSENDADHRYRITRTDRGILVSCRHKSRAGLLLGPAEWLYQTYEAAEKGLEVVMLFNAWWTAITGMYSSGDLPQRCKAAIENHIEAVDRLHDEPLIGAEVRELRIRHDS